ncbi:MAG TPA: PQQ-binding-like beta-propeller repeat protein [Kofleriaceae bacterium]
MKKGLLLAIAITAAACGPKHVFRLSADENNAYALKETLAKRQLPGNPAPVNSQGSPRVFVLAAGSPKTIIAYDLAGQSVMWKVDADVQSRIFVGGDFILDVEGKQLVARDQARGTPRWKVDLDGQFIGAAADRERAYLVTKSGSEFTLTGYAGSDGSRLWRDGAAGALGAPGAHGGVVYVPFLSQWLSIVDGKSGAQLTRLRGLDEQISTLRVTSTVAYYGSKRGMFRLDERSASGKRDQSSYATVEIPAQLERTTYNRDAYDPIQQGYTAADRARVLWSSEPTTDGPMKLTGDGYAIHYFRYVLGFDAKGEMRWAYSNPRVELVASVNTDTVIAAVDQNGEIIALDPNTGGVLTRMSIGGAAQVLGATFDADGWRPSGQPEKLDQTAALVAIARDHDARFERVKELAVVGLARQPGSESTKELLAILADDRAPVRLKDTVVQLLVQRRDATSLPILVEQLAVHDDAIAKTETETLGAIAKAIAGLAETTVDPANARAALTALQFHLDAPSTGMADLVLVIDAMTAVGGGEQKAALASHLLLYHADDDRGGDPAWQKAIVSAIATHPTPADRAVLRYVQADPRSKTGLAQQIELALPSP